MPASSRKTWQNSAATNDASSLCHENSSHSRSSDTWLARRLSLLELLSSADFDQALFAILRHCPKSSKHSNRVPSNEPIPVHEPFLEKYFRNDYSPVAPEYKYKAFISYAHEDEKWAKWLHRALESYRLAAPRGAAVASRNHCWRAIAAP